MKLTMPFLLLALAMGGCAGTRAPVTVVAASAVEWGALNPARGDASPRAATLWGDRNGEGPTGFLVRFVDGFESPPHIHNVSYRGVVIEGLVHNDDPAAEAQWMPAGSFWTQPKGGAHITAARGGDTIAYIEIDQGPYLVRPVEQAFIDDEAPVNVDASKVAWTGDPPTAPLWSSPAGERGVMVKLPPGFTGSLDGGRVPFRAVVIGGHVTGVTDAAPLAPGSYFSATGAVPIGCTQAAECVLYVRTGDDFDVRR